jgi:outer membrane protein
LAALKEDEKAKAMKDIESMRGALTEFVQAKRTDLMKEEEGKTREILLEMEKIIGDFAKKEGYDMIINDRVLLYSNPALDVTEPVTKLMNESYNKK